MKKGAKTVLNMILGVGVMAFSLFLFVSVLSYNELDSSLNTTSGSDMVFNSMGVAGAYFSDFFIQMFGIISFFIVFVIAKIGFNTFRSGVVRYNIYLKLVMSIMLILSGCALASKLFIHKNYWGCENAGGTVGYYINNLTIYLPNNFLCIFHSIVVVLSSIILTDFSYKKFYLFLFRTTKRINVVAKCIYRVLIKLLIFLVPQTFIRYIKKLITKINSKINKRKDEREQYKNMIEMQNKKIESLEKYIENININKNDQSDVEDKTIEPKNKDKGIFSLFNKEKNSTSSVKPIKASKYKVPTLDLLDSSNNKIMFLTKEELRDQASELLKVLKDFKINGRIMSVKAGPVITLHEFEPSAGTKSSRIIGLADDIARNLKVKSTRISVIPERNVVGIELPNRVRNTIFLKDIFETNEYKNSNYALPIVLGSDIAGNPVIMDLAKAPHLLIAGTTGSGKSVSINTMILSLLYKFSPDECRMIMIDPKMLELSVYEGIPHLLAPVVTDPKKAVMSLKWVVNEMENRYRTMSSIGVRNIYGYNEKVKEALHDNTMLSSKMLVGYDKYGEPIYENKELETKQLPFIVVIVDEMADLMITAGKDIESLIQRIAQMARAAGIHIIMATQRPSVDIVTGVIKANFPSRISFLVSSKIDSKVIIGEQGAEQLLGMGDLLYMPNGGKINRAHGPFVSDGEIENVVGHILEQGIKPEYVKTTVDDDDENDNSGDENFDISINGKSSDEELYRSAIEIIKRDKKISISYLQRQLGVGYNKSAKLVERMEKEGIISPANNSGKREIIE
ncbi:MAG: DNA translocase FtsK 4TM domain-containing protein [Rickettsiales bacterium]|jgi:S-DNA-T family DNA segregation ATPase FtsK/SpoIIIE|nr:DNA translocase FtsK 4TM domain-containing protein [Rickettsiales bacterium]